MIPYPRFLALARANICLLAETRERGLRVLSVHYEQGGGPVDFLLQGADDEFHLARVVPDHARDDWAVQWIEKTRSAA